MTLREALDMKPEHILFKVDFAKWGRPLWACRDDMDGKPMAPIKQEVLNAEVLQMIEATKNYLPKL